MGESVVYLLFVCHDSTHRYIQCQDWRMMFSCIFGSRVLNINFCEKITHNSAHILVCTLCVWITLLWSPSSGCLHPSSKRWWGWPTHPCLQPQGTKGSPASCTGTLWSESRVDCVPCCVAELSGVYKTSAVGTYFPNYSPHIAQLPSLWVLCVCYLRIVDTVYFKVANMYKCITFFLSAYCYSLMKAAESCRNVWTQSFLG